MTELAHTRSRQDGGGPEQMRAEGEIEPASEDVGDLPEPLVLSGNIESPSAALVRRRRDEP